MRKIILLVFSIILNLQLSIKADDIRDFEIEGMSVGDSLLSYFSEKQIKKKISGAQYPNKEFILYYFKNLSSFKTYEAVTVAVKANDKNYIIHDLGGSIYFKNNFEECLLMLKEISVEMKKTFSNARTGSGKESHPIDTSGKTVQHYHIFELENGDNSQVVCLNYSKELENQGHTDELNLTLGTGEYGDFVMNRAYN
tara:strand:+ start:176 stop:766 length:591 start_codon:yes stop_codon:yes gene_type:complete